MLHPLAEHSNATIREAHPTVHAMLSAVGRALYFPKGILTQSAEAGKQAHRYNATIGIATEGGQAMHLACVDACFADDLSPSDLYPYAPTPGLPPLREAWQVKQREETPSLGDHPTSLPLVTNALTHGLDLVGELFLDPGDTVLVPDKRWDNYQLSFGDARQAKIVTFDFFTPQLDGMDVEALRRALAGLVGGKVIILLNFPNNPTGYSCTKAEAAVVTEILTEAAAAGTRIIAVCDDAYYGMFYDEDCATESLFGGLAQAHENLLAVKLDGATKEMFVWALRVGFITYGIKGGNAALYQALEAKTGGAIRASLSNVNRPGQMAVLRALRHPEFRSQQAAKVAILRERAMEVRRVLADPAFHDCWQVYPFNAGYFMCLRIIGVDAEVLRLHLLAEHGLGTIALSDSDLRVAFSCLEHDQIADVFARIAQGVRHLRAG